MKEFFTSPITKNTSRIALIIFTAFAAVLYFFRMATYTYVAIEFNEARPIPKHLPVFYKGYKVGEVVKIKPSPDFTSTLAIVAIFEPYLKLPGNTTALLTREKRDRKEYDFINLIYPEHPGEQILKSGDRITGFTTVDLESFFSQKAVSGELDIMKDNVNNLLTSLNSTAEALTGLFDILQDLVNENRPNIMTTTSNLADTSSNLKLFSMKLNNSVNEKQIQNTLSNIDTTSASVVITTRNFETITKNIDAITGSVNTTMPDVTSSITRANRIAKNIDEITTGVSSTLKQNFGGMKLLFGKPIKTPKCIYTPTNYPSCNPGSNIICK